MDLAIAHRPAAAARRRDRRAVRPGDRRPRRRRSSPARAADRRPRCRSVVFVDIGFGHEQVLRRAARSPGSTSGTLDVDWALRVDTLTAVMLIVVTVVSSMVHVYSIGYMARRPVDPALHGLSQPVHLLHADAGDGRQPRAAVLRLGGRRPLLLPADRLLVRPAGGQCRGDQGLRRQPHRRLRLRARHLRAFWMLSARSTSTTSSPRRRSMAADDVSCSSAWQCRRSRPPACCCSSAPWASRPSSACTPGCPTRWKARPRSPP